MDEGGVDAAVIHPPGWDPGATAMAFAAVRALSRPVRDHGGVCRWTDRRTARWWRPGGASRACSVCATGSSRSRCAAGWRMARSTGSGPPPSAPASRSRCWRRIRLPAVGRIAERHPGLRLTIDHLGGKGGNTTLKDAAAMTHMPALLALAKHPNVAVKATGAPGYSSEAYPFPAMQTFVRQIYDAFGPQRLFWGTDITKMPCSWRQCVTMFTEELPWLSEEDKALIMGQAVCAWWGWDRSA